MAEEVWFPPWVVFRGKDADKKERVYLILVECWFNLIGTQERDLLLRIQGIMRRVCEC